MTIFFEILTQFIPILIYWIGVSILVAIWYLITRSPVWLLNRQDARWIVGVLLVFLPSICFALFGYDYAQIFGYVFGGFVCAFLVKKALDYWVAERNHARQEPFTQLFKEALDELAE